MRRPRPALYLLCVMLLASLWACTGPTEQVQPDPTPTPAPEPEAAKPGLKYPETRSQDIKETLHGQEVADPYRWLEDVSSPEVQAWMKAQNDLTREQLDALPGRDQLKERYKQLFYVDSLSAPIKRGDRYFYRRRHADREKAVIYWRQGEHGAEKVLLDPNTMGGEGQNISLGRWVPSWDGQKVAYLIKENNADEATLYVMEVATGQVSDVDVIPGAKYASPEWTPKNDGFYYTWLPTDTQIPTADRPGFSNIRFHKLGTPPEKDPVIQKKLGDSTKFLSPALSRDGRWLFRYIFHGWARTEIAVRDLKSKDTEFKPFYAPEKSNASVTAWRDHFYIHTNENAPRYQILRTSTRKMDQKHWKVVVPEREDVVIEEMQIVGEHMVLTLLRNATSAMEVRKLDGTLVREVPLPGIGSTFGMSGNPDEDAAYFSYASFTTPWQIYKTSIQSGSTKLWSQVEVPVDPSPYTVEQAWFTSKDGTRVPMFLVHRKDIPRDGSTPWLLYGYGGFDVSLKPYFRSSIYPWLEAGGGYAVANLRGGGEFGDAWHKSGMMDQKQNVFDDFIAAGEFLVQEKYTSSDKLAIYGGSNGGLLVGAAMTQRPDLFGAVVCSVPLLDMVRYHLFGSGKTWIGEYGSAEDAEQFKALRAYSPYHRVQPGTAYPPTLFLSADNDDRVDPLHARKMAAALQAANSAPSPILLRIQANAGHGGADRVEEAVEESVDLYSFLMATFGMQPAAPKGE